MDSPYAWAFTGALALAAGLAYYSSHVVIAVVLAILTLGMLAWMMYTTVTEKMANGKS